MSISRLSSLKKYCTFFIFLLCLGIDRSWAQTEIVFAQADSNQDEDEGVINVRLNITNPDAADFPVQITLAGTATEGVDYTIAGLAGGQINIPANSATFDIQIDITDDNIFEPNETVIIDITNCACPVASIIQHTLTIENEDPEPTISFNTIANTALEGDAGTQDFNIQVNISNPSSAATNVVIRLTGTATYGTTGTGDYFTDPVGAGNPREFTLNFPANSTDPLNIALTVRGDDTNENDNTVIFTIIDGAGYNPAAAPNNVHTHTIQNDDTTLISFATAQSNGAEGNTGTTQVNVAVTLTNPRTLPTLVTITLGGTATYTTDYDTNPAAAGNPRTVAITFPANSTAPINIRLDIEGDVTSEPDETVILTINDAVAYDIGANGVHTHTIANDDLLIYLVAEGVTASNDSDNNPTTNQQFLVVNTPFKEVTFTALPLPPTAEAYKFFWNDGFNPDIEVANGTLINGVQAVINNNSARLNVGVGDRVRAIITIDGQENETDYIVVSDSPFTGLPNAECITRGNINFQIGDNTWNQINVNPAPPEYFGPIYRRMQLSDGTPISNTRNGTINTNNLGIGTYEVQVIVDYQFGTSFTFPNILWVIQTIAIGEPTAITVSPTFTDVYCENQDIEVDLANFFEPEGGTFSIDGDPVTLLNPTNFPTNNFTPDTYDLVYQYTNEFNCETSITRTITINPAPSTAFGFENTCLGDVTQFTADVAANNTPEANFIYSWTIDNQPVNGRTPTFQFTSPGEKIVRLTVINTATGCQESVEQSVFIHALPKADFTFSNVCSLSPSFQNLSVIDGANPTSNQINSLTWDFGDGNTQVVNANFNAPISHTYSTHGSYQVRLIASTVQGCADTLTQTVNIFPLITLNQGDAYIENFDAGEGNWIPGGVNRSWQHKVPSNRNIQRASDTDFVWITNNADTTYNASEKSYIECPCINLTNIVNPMINLRIWTDTELTGDGATLLYTIVRNTDDNTDANNVWKAVSLKSGTQSIAAGGLDWYNQENILGVLSDPIAGQNVTDNPRRVGWAGKDADWKIAKFPLDEVQREAIETGQGIVRFRIAFGSNADNPINDTFDGFALDTVLITERNRLTLIEHFTNTQIQAITNTTSERELNEILGLEETQRTLLMRYLTSFPTNDPNISTFKNIADNGARALFYNVADLTRTLIDGERPFQQNPQTFTANTGYWNDFKAAQTQRILNQPNINISNLTVSPADNNTALRVQVSISRPEDVLPTTNPFLVQVCLIEKNLPAPYEDFRNVVRAFLPSLSGAARLTWEDLETPQEIDFIWPANQNISTNDFMLVVFVQDEITKTIHQAQDIEINFAVDAPGGRSNQADVGNDPKPQFDFTIYPNPSRVDCNVWFTTLEDKIQPWILRDNQGKIVFEGEVPAETQMMQLKTDDLPSGVYTLQVGKIIKRLVID